MLVNMLVRGGIMVAGLVATNAVLEKVEKSVLKRMNDKKVKSEDKREWYTAEMETVDGFNYRTSVKANNIEEAREFILHDAYKGNKVLSIKKGEL